MIVFKLRLSILLCFVITFTLAGYSCRNEDECELPEELWWCENNKVMYCESGSPGGLASIGNSGNTAVEKKDCDDYKAVCVIEPSSGLSDDAYCAFPDESCKEDYTTFCVNNCECTCSDSQNYPLIGNYCEDSGTNCEENATEQNADCV